MTHPVFNQPPQPITAERIEAALNKLALIMGSIGDRAEELLPLYERLEEELKNYRAKGDKLAAVRERAKQLKAASRRK